jgi:lipopolysaccharide transport system ATP-binding protein
MYVRLAFAVAAHLEPEILLVDEVLAVGDAAFQRKCMGKMDDVARHGRTILFVSHNMGAVTRLCSRALWLERGELKAEGPTEDVVGRYLAEDTSDAGEVSFDGEDRAPGSEDVRLAAVRVLSSDGNISSTLDARRPFHIEVEYDVLKDVSELRVGVRLLTYDGTCILSSTDCDETGHEFTRAPGRHISRCTIPAGFLNFGQYFVTVGCDYPLRKTHFVLDPALTMRIEPTGGVGAHISDGRPGILRMQLPWSLRSVEK